MVKEEFNCILSKNMKYEQVAAKVAEHLKVQPTHLRFTSSTSDGRPRNLPIKRTGPLSTVQQFMTHGGMPLPGIVFYEVLELSLADMESKREVTITWLPDGVAVLVPLPLPVERARNLCFYEIVLIIRNLSRYLYRDRRRLRKSSKRSSRNTPPSPPRYITGYVCSMSAITKNTANSSSHRPSQQPVWIPPTAPISTRKPFLQRKTTRANRIDLL
jgi:hypothetical protein